MTKNSITYAGHSAVFLSCGGTKIALDPWLKGNPLCPPELQNPSHLDLIVLSHGHADHAGDAVRVAQLSGAKLAATYELAMLMIAEGVPSDKVIPMNKGGSVTVAGSTVTLTHAFHSSSFDTANGAVYAGEACGIVISSPGWTVYHAGDTALFGDMERIGTRYQPDVALLPIGDHFTMGPDEAAESAALLRCGCAIPIHYKTFGLLTGTYEAFQAACRTRGVESLELKPGETREW
jgi:L-ascorbate metabolism protein UlaG (beta-lactamase superfamily)